MGKEFIEYFHNKDFNKFFSNQYITVVKRSTYKWITNFHKDEWSVYYGAIKNSRLTERLVLLDIAYDIDGNVLKDYCSMNFTDINDDRDLNRFWKVFDRTKKRVEEGYSPVEMNLYVLRGK